MARPKKQRYGVDPFIYQAALYDAMNPDLADIPFFRKWAKRQKGRALELCCGSGRVTIPLKEAGIEITGLDFNRAMLEAARAKAEAKGLSIAWVKQDMRALQLGKKFDLIFIPFHSLQNTYRLEDLEKVFAGVRRHLAPKGRFIIDLFHPSIRLLYERELEAVKRYDCNVEGMGHVEVLERTQYEPADQVLRVYWTCRVGGKPGVIKELDMRCFFPQEMEALLKYNGFRIERFFGDYDESPFTAESAKQIYVCGVAGRNDFRSSRLLPSGRQ